MRQPRSSATLRDEVARRCAEDSGFDTFRNQGRLWREYSEHVNACARDIPVGEPPTCQRAITAQTLTQWQALGAHRFHVFRKEPPRRKGDAAAQRSIVPRKPFRRPRLLARVSATMLTHLHEWFGKVDEAAPKRHLCEKCAACAVKRSVKQRIPEGGPANDTEKIHAAVR
jgi:hypothetical protein